MGVVMGRVGRVGGVAGGRGGRLGVVVHGVVAVVGEGFERCLGNEIHHHSLSCHTLNGPVVA